MGIGYPMKEIVNFKVEPIEVPIFNNIKDDRLIVTIVFSHEQEYKFVIGKELIKVIGNLIKELIED